MTPARPTDTLERTPAVLRVHADDNVGAALMPLEPGERVDIAGRQLTISDTINQGHKFALENNEADMLVQRFGWPKREIAIWKRGVTL